MVIPIDRSVNINCEVNDVLEHPHYVDRRKMHPAAFYLNVHI